MFSGLEISPDIFAINCSIPMMPSPNSQSEAPQSSRAEVAPRPSLEQKPPAALVAPAAARKEQPSKQKRQPPVSEKAYLQDLSYISCLLERPSNDVSWGLSLFFANNSSLVICETSSHHASLIQSMWCGSCVMHPILFQRNQMDVSAFTRYLFTLIPKWTPSGLLPGDLIVGINGFSVGSFKSLEEAKSIMVASSKLTLLIARHPNATVAAQKTRTLSGLSTATKGTNNATGSAPVRSAIAASSVYEKLHTAPIRRPPPKPHYHNTPRPKPIVRNPLFSDPKDPNKLLPYCDNDIDTLESLQCQDNRSTLFLSKLLDNTKFQEWLSRRTTSWKKSYSWNVLRTKKSVKRNRLFLDENGCQIPFCDNEEEWSPEDGARGNLFLSDLDDTHITEWVQRKSLEWRQKYSWNVRKRRRLEESVEEHIRLSEASFGKWLELRKKQWKILRRKRLRKSSSVQSPEKRAENCQKDGPPSPTSVIPKSLDLEVLAIDAMLEEEEQRKRLMDSRGPPDISFLFDSSQGCPDDIIVHCLRFLNPEDHCRLMSLSRKTREGLASRENVWRQLCPKHWTLPRRPRKPWHIVYMTKLRDETETARKRWDDLLAKVSAILLKGDQFQSIEKLVNEAERDCGYNVNYTSGVVCERNSVLNLAVIHGRHKVARWLIEEKKADIESYDRGGFTPLLNAAWAGDRYLVRLLMQRGADRSKVGTSHYTKALAAPDFKGLTAAGWASKRGHHEIACLIQMGL